MYLAPGFNFFLQSKQIFSSAIIIKIGSTKDPLGGEPFLTKVISGYQTLVGVLVLFYIYTVSQISCLVKSFAQKSLDNFMQNY